jgi:hypothetical protein
MMKNNYAVARRIPGYTGADRCHNTGSFVTIDAWRSEKVVFDFLEIGMADPTAFDADQNLARRDGGCGDRLNRYAAMTEIDSGPHQTGRRLNGRGGCLRLN